MLRCVECERTSHGNTRRWRGYLTVDGHVVIYCPTCALQEFGPRKPLKRSA
jgi:hypothetical protein